MNGIATIVNWGRLRIALLCLVVWGCSKTDPPQTFRALLTKPVANITVEEAAIGRTTILANDQRDLLVKEMTKINANDGGPGYYPATVAPDSRLIVKLEDDTLRTFALLGNWAVIYDEQGNRTQQFYFGQTVRDWLHGPHK